MDVGATGASLWSGAVDVAVNGNGLLWLVTGVGGALASMLATAAIAVLLPANHFLRPEKSFRKRGVFGTGRIVLWAVKNCIGAALVAVGAILLLTPGPGLMAIVIGFGIMEFHGKRRVLLWALHQGEVLPTLNRLRRRFGRPELINPDDVPGSAD